MADPRNRNKQPVLIPPQGEHPVQSSNPLIIVLIVVCLLSLLLLTALVIWFLPLKTPSTETKPEVAREEVVSSKQVERVQADPDKQAAERALEAWLKAQAVAESDNAQSWGTQEYRAIIDFAARGDQLFRDGEFSSAGSLYQQSIDRLELLLASKGEKLETALVLGEQALTDGHSQKALAHFQQALLLDPENEQAKRGNQRAATLDKVLALYNKGLREEGENNLAQALQLFAEARAMDSHFTSAVEAQNRVEQKQQDLSFQQAMSQAITALNKERLTEADNALNTAERLRPASPAVTAARQRYAEIHTVQRLRELRYRAEQLIGVENWEAVVETYNTALQIDQEVGFANTGLPEATKRLELDRSLKAIISQPERLQDTGPLREAGYVLNSAQQVDDPGSVLQSQIERVSTLVEKASTTIEVILRSDSATEIEIYHVGRFRPFLENRVKLRPGSYTVVGRRAGFKDTRMSIRIDAEMEKPVFVIRCEEPI